VLLELNVLAASDYRGVDVDPGPHAAIVAPLLALLLPTG
jgi:hypothetical protein